MDAGIHIDIHEGALPLERPVDEFLRELREES